MNPPAPVSEWIGQITVNAWFCALVKGQGKVVYDPNQVDPTTGNTPRRYTAIDMELAAITDQPLDPIKRNMLAEFGEWIDIVLPSLKDIGITNLQSLNGQWVRLETVGTGRKYTDKNGEQKEATTFKFVEIFANEAVARNAWQVKHGNSPSAISNTPAAATAHQAAAAQSTGNGNKERETALKFLKPYAANAWRQASGDMTKAIEIFGQMIAKQSLLSKYFTADSPEVLDELSTLATGTPA